MVDGFFRPRGLRIGPTFEEQERIRSIRETPSLLESLGPAVGRAAGLVGQAIAGIPEEKRRAAEFEADQLARDVELARKGVRKRIPGEGIRDAVEPGLELPEAPGRVRGGRFPTIEPVPIPDPRTAPRGFEPDFPAVPLPGGPPSAEPRSGIDPGFGIPLIDIPGREGFVIDPNQDINVILARERERLRALGRVDTAGQAAAGNQAAFEQVNAARQRQGLPPLEFDPGIDFSKLLSPALTSEATGERQEAGAERREEATEESRQRTGVRENVEGLAADRAERLVRAGTARKTALESIMGSISAERFMEELGIDALRGIARDQLAEAEENLKRERERAARQGSRGFRSISPQSPIQAGDNAPGVDAGTAGEEQNVAELSDEQTTLLRGAANNPNVTPEQILKILKDAGATPQQMAAARVVLGVDE